MYNLYFNKKKICCKFISQQFWFPLYFWYWILLKKKTINFTNIFKNAILLGAGVGAAVFTGFGALVDTPGTGAMVDTPGKGVTYGLGVRFGFGAGVGAINWQYGFWQHLSIGSATMLHWAGTFGYLAHLKQGRKMYEINPTSKGYDNMLKILSWLCEIQFESVEIVKHFLKMLSFLRSLKCILKLNSKSKNNFFITFHKQYFNINHSDWKIY